jgi:hypothetical protein
LSLWLPALREQFSEWQHGAIEIDRLTASKRGSVESKQWTIQL